MAPIAIRRRHLTSPEDARRRAWRHWEYGTPILTNAGWHFSCMSDASGIKLKLESFSHQEYNAPEFTDLDAIASKVRYGLDLVGRPDQFWCCVPLDSSFPRCVLDQPQAFADLVADFDEFHVNRQLLILELYAEVARITGEIGALKREVAKLNDENSHVRNQLKCILRSNRLRKNRVE
jgi:hypothetical protein